MIRKSSFLIALVGMVLLAGCAAPPKADESTAKPATSSTAPADAKDSKPADSAAATPEAKPEAKPDTAAATKPEPAKPEANANAAPPTKETSPEKDEVTAPKPNDDRKITEKVPDPPKPRVPAERVNPSGDAKPYAGKYKLLILGKNDFQKLQAMMQKKKGPQMIAELEIKADGTYSWKFGPSMAVRTITGTVQVKENKVILSPYMVDGKPADTPADKVVYNMEPSEGGKKLTTIVNIGKNGAKLVWGRV